MARRALAVELAQQGEIYGRGTADNKGQHAINLAALATVIAERGRLGFNAKVLIETSEEIGSPGLREICESHQAQLSADLLLGSDGPRLAPTSRPSTSAAAARSISIWWSSSGIRPSFGQLGRPARPIRRSCSRMRSRPSSPGRPDSDSRSEAARPAGRGRAGARRPVPDAGRRGARRGRARDRPGLGRAGPDPGRKGVRLEQLRGPRLDRWRSRPPGQCHPAARLRPLPDPLHGRQRAQSLPASDPQCQLDVAGLWAVEVRPARA